MGRSNFLEPLKNIKKNVKIATFDIEAKNFIDFEILGFYDGKDYKLYHSVEDFIDHTFIRKYSGYSFYAHYGGKYDFLFLMEYLFLKFDIVIPYLANSRIIMVKVYKGKEYWNLIDSYNILPYSLDKLCNTFNVKHKKIPFDFETWTGDIEAHLKNDCLGLYEILNKYKTYGFNEGCRFSITLSAQAMEVYRRKYLKHKIENLTDKQETFLRQSYFGGRVEIFKMYGTGLNIYDINSLYPSVMLNKMPIGDYRFTSKYYADKPSFYEAEVKIPYTYIPNLPLLHNNKLLFTYGSYKGFFTNIELNRLKSIGGSFKILKGLVAFKSDYIFNGYVEDMYNLKTKSKNNSVDYSIAKLFLNGLYGKFAQKRERKTLISCSVDEAFNKDYIPYKADFNLFEFESKSSASFIIPSISCYITSLARDYLYSNMLKVGLKNIYYCDTDSIVTNKEIKTSTKIGGWSVVNKDVKGVFILPKLYSIKSKNNEYIKAKGFNNLNIKYNDFKRALDTDNYKKLTVTFKKVGGFCESLKRFNKPLARFEMTKRVNCRYDKRIRLNNYDTKPIKLI